MTRTFVRLAVVATVLFVPFAGLVPRAIGQTRAEEIASQQAEKAGRLHPYEPTRGEALMIRAERAFMGPPTGLYPWIGSIFPSGLLSAGPGVRVPFARRAAFDAQAAISLKGFRLARATVTLPPLANRRVRTNVHAQLVDATRVSFFGIGNESDRDARSAYRLRQTMAGGAIAVAPMAYVDVGGGFDYLGTKVTEPTRGTAASARFTPDEAPGLQAAPTYIVTRAHAAVDWRDSPGYTRRGGLYRLDWSRYDETSDGAFSFTRLDADLRQMIPILRENWILAFRAAIATTTTDGRNEVPFFLLPQLGGGSDLRGYASWRFRDRNKILVSAEYRWTPARFVDMAIFHDAGKVTAERGDLSLRGLHHTNGIGIRFHAPSATFLRFEVAKSAERLGFVMTFGQSF